MDISSKCYGGQWANSNSKYEATSSSDFATHMILLKSCMVFMCTVYCRVFTELLAAARGRTLSFGCKVTSRMFCRQACSSTLCQLPQPHRSWWCHFRWHQSPVPDSGLGTLGACPGDSTRKGLHKSRHKKILRLYFILSVILCKLSYNYAFFLLKSIDKIEIIS